MIQFGVDFSTAGVPEAGLSPTISIRDTSDGSVVINAVAMIEVGGGAYKYNFTNDTSKKYSAVMDGGVDTVDARYQTAWSERAKAEAEVVEIKTETDKIQMIDDNVDRILTATEIRQCEVNDASASSTKFITNLTETDNNFWVRAAVLFTSGDNAGQIRAIKQYAGATKEVTIQTPLNSSPANGDTFIICTARKFLTPDTLELADAVNTELGTHHGTGSWEGGGDAGGYTVIGGLQDTEIKKMFKLLEKILKVVKSFSIKSLTEAVTGIEESIQRKQEIFNSSLQKVGEQIKEIPQPIDLKEDVEVLQSALETILECEEFKQIFQEVKEDVDIKIAQIEG